MKPKLAGSHSLLPSIQASFPQLEIRKFEDFHKPSCEKSGISDENHLSVNYSSLATSSNPVVFPANSNNEQANSSQKNSEDFIKSHPSTQRENQQPVQFVNLVNPITQFPLAGTSTFNSQVKINPTFIIQQIYPCFIEPSQLIPPNTYIPKDLIENDSKPSPSQNVQTGFKYVIPTFPTIQTVRQPSAQFIQIPLYSETSFPTSQPLRTSNSPSKTSTPVSVDNSVSKLNSGIKQEHSISPQEKNSEQSNTSMSARINSISSESAIFHQQLPYEIDPVSLGFLPRDYWASKTPISVETLKRDFFRARSSKSLRFEYKLWNALAITKEYPPLFSEIGIKWVSKYLIMVHRDIFGKLLNVSRPSAALFSSCGAFMTHGFKEVSKGEAKLELAYLKRRNLSINYPNASCPFPPPFYGGVAYQDPKSIPATNFEQISAEDIILPAEVDESVIRLFIHKSYELSEDSPPSDLPKCKWNNEARTSMKRYQD